MASSCENLVNAVLPQAASIVCGIDISASQTILLVLAFLFPLAILAGKWAVGRNRLRDLIAIRASLKTSGPADIATVLPTFEAAQLKYSPPDKISVDGFKENQEWLSSVATYALTIAAFVLIAALGVNNLVIGDFDPAKIVIHPSGYMRLIVLGLVPSYHPGDEVLIDYARETLVMLSAAFLGAYLSAITYLIRRVNKFDLEPYSFLFCGIRIIMALAVVLAARHLFLGTSWQDLADVAARSKATTITTASATDGTTPAADPKKLDVQPTTPTEGKGAPKTNNTVTSADPNGTPLPKPNPFGPSFVIAFLLGLYPSAGLELLIKRFPDLNLRKADDGAQKMRRSIPIDSVDGIDTFIGYRLEEQGIDEVQTLATVNPILLYVETPYNLATIIDWVAQSQLLIAVGPERTFALRALNIRTVFDLVRAIEVAELRQAIITLILSTPSATGATDIDAALQQLRQSSTDAESAGRIVKGLVQIIADDLHVQRLAQIWNFFSMNYRRDMGFSHDVALRGLVETFSPAAPPVEEVRATSFG